MSKEKQEYRLQLRVDRTTYNRIEKTIELVPGLTKSGLLREALNMWLNIGINHMLNPETDICLTTTNTLRIAFNSMNEAQIRQMALKSYENYQYNREKFRMLFPGNQLDELLEPGELDDYKPGSAMSIDARIQTLNRIFYGSSGYHWLTEFDYKIIDEKAVKIKAEHQLGIPFSQFFIQHIGRHFLDFDYFLAEEELTQKKKKDTPLINEVNLKFEKTPQPN